MNNNNPTQKGLALAISLASANSNLKKIISYKRNILAVDESFLKIAPYEEKIAPDSGVSDWGLKWQAVYNFCHWARPKEKPIYYMNRRFNKIHTWPTRHYLLSCMQLQSLEKVFLFNKFDLVDQDFKHTTIDEPVDPLCLKEFNKNNQDDFQIPIRKNPFSLQRLAYEAACKKDIEKFTTIATEDIGNIMFQDFIKDIIFNPKMKMLYPKVDRLNLMQFIGLGEGPNECLYEEIDKKFDKKLNNVLPKIKDASDQRLSKFKTLIESYLNGGADITIALKKIVLYNDSLFSAKLYDPTEPLSKLAKWILQEKNGWQYIDLIAANGLDVKELSRSIRLMNLAPYHPHYDILLNKILDRSKMYVTNPLVLQLFMSKKDNIKAIDDAFKTAMYNGDIKAIRVLKNCADSVNINGAIEELVEKRLEYDYRHYIKVCSLLLEWGGDPNLFFYRDKNGKKECFIKNSPESIRTLLTVLNHPDRKKDIDEPSDTSYLMESVSGYSSFFIDNFREKFFGYSKSYIEKLIGLCYQALTTKDIKPVQDHIQNQWDQLSILEKTSDESS